ncbi:diaminopimelate epimerase [Pseudofulvibacter geojedonensis]|uniref:Diaminopimelate epimerase n=1 Tax=Pseudofulvibacter geojedonensis TaxID=1123758 RepID=A0ABW3HZ81_9FLAO
MLTFYKYQGTGNDFVMIDNRQDIISKNDTKKIQFLCNRKFGVGADGLILLEKSDSVDFKMVYFNADGNESTMCGNGGRCLVAFANMLGVVKNETTFEAIDGLHYATINKDRVSLQMQNVTRIENKDGAYFLDTGSPHHVTVVDNVAGLDVYKEGKRIRNDVYGNEGSNVNFVEQLEENTFKIRTYERGVEDETLSCGTGATAVAIAMHKSGMTKSDTVVIKVEGGELQISFKNLNNVYNDVFLIGKAVQVFKGEILW